MIKPVQHVKVNAYVRKFSSLGVSCEPDMLVTVNLWSQANQSFHLMTHQVHLSICLSLTWRTRFDTCMGYDSTADSFLKVAYALQGIQNIPHQWQAHSTGPCCLIFAESPQVSCSWPFAQVWRTATCSLEKLVPVLWRLQSFVRQFAGNWDMLQALLHKADCTVHWPVMIPL